MAVALLLLASVVSPTTANAQNFSPIAKSDANADVGVGVHWICVGRSHAVAEVPKKLSGFGPSSGSRDSALENRIALVVHVLAPPTATLPSKSSVVALNPAGTELWVVNPDANSVLVLAVSSNSVTKLVEVPVGRHPRTLAFSPDGSRVYVACHGTNELWVLDTTERTVLRRILVGYQPYGVAVLPGDGRILVSSEGHGTVSVIYRLSS